MVREGGRMEHCGAFLLVEWDVFCFSPPTIFLVCCLLLLLRTVTYDVKYEHFPIVGEALLHTLEQALGDEFTTEVREAWTAVYHFITKHMTDGMKDLLE